MSYKFEILIASLILWLMLGSASHVTARQTPPLPSPVAVTATPGQVVRAPTPRPADVKLYLPIVAQ